MSDDAQLLRQFAEKGSQAAFAELVHRHLDLVYGAALRRTGGDVQCAADIAQEVFIQLARRAGSLAAHPALGAWLHTATRNAALNAMISDQRRRDRERAAASLSPPEPGAPDWNAIRPVLDGAIDELPEPDRLAVVLRFLERKPFAEIAAALRVSEDAARMRTDRALEKLRAALQGRGITSTAAAVELLLTAEAAVAAPTGLAAAIVPAATAGSSLLAFTTALMTPKLIVTGIVIAIAAFWAGTRFHPAQPSVQAVPPVGGADQSGSVTALRSENDRLKAERVTAQRAANQPNPVESPPATGVGSVANDDRANRIRLEQERRIMAHLRQLGAACDQYYKENEHAPISLDEIVGEGPGKYIRILEPVNGESYVGLPLGPRQVLSVTMKDGTTVTYDPSGPQTTKIPGPIVDLVQIANGLGIEPASLQHAWDAYLAAHGQAIPKTPLELVPYFATVEEAATYSQALERHQAGQKK